ncbi:hypothetical protein [Massilia aquatica]|uniref:DUF1640 domain-containing protein n=1 Tax=Massilia aquatica TaxID=2609000 RepID=A0ABX0M4J7_9BURK|nr:hypothetical protein [Massilia aquatica]NHZ41847.1 hypothetical protein [Massilia aquatica]
MTIEFDPIAYAQQLESTGVPRQQADVHAKALNEVASEGVSISDRLQMKNDWQCDIRQSDQRLTAQINRAKTELSAELQTFRAEFSAKIGVLDAKIDAVRNDLNAKIDSVRTELNAKIEMVAAELRSVKHELTIHRWLFGLLIAMNGAMLGRIYFP